MLRRPQADVIAPERDHDLPRGTHGADQQNAKAQRQEYPRVRSRDLPHARRHCDTLGPFIVHPQLGHVV